MRVSEVAGVVGADAAEGRTTLTVRTLGGRTQQLSADHVIAATGYRVDLAALDCIGPALRTESAAASYGPVMRFVCGTEFASPRLARHLEISSADRSQPGPPIRQCGEGDNESVSSTTDNGVGPCRHG
ncbi:hypothetical protein AQJ91_11355 [Streptomyces dysideae]|uniref:FAD/NAD(P)-binding domain-containing protein n=1 Tax=Streptomyces dysideae TaxID=909626 RepID=A0A117S1V4_9ACTN|nr:hypothetical protein AQJ91_11355 [Streptomyces dysideae]